MSFEYTVGINPNPNYPIDQQIANGDAEVLVFQDGWFLDDSRGLGYPFYLFVTDGVTREAQGTPGFTIASNAPELKQSALFGIATSYYPFASESLTPTAIQLTINASDAQLSNLPPHPITNLSSPDQKLLSGVESILWYTGNGSDTFTLQLNSPTSPLSTVQIDLGDGDDRFVISGRLDALHDQWNGVFVQESGIPIFNAIIGGGGNDRVEINANSYEGYYLQSYRDSVTGVEAEQTTPRWGLQQGDVYIGLLGVETVSFLDRTFEASKVIFGDVLRSGDFLEGSPADDYIMGTDKSNTIHAEAGDDVIVSGDGHDRVDGGNGNDLIIGGSGRGNDRYDGGKGLDWVTYLSALSGLSVDLGKGRARGAEIGKDTLRKIEAVRGSNFDDVITGSKKADQLHGEAGDDTFKASKGLDLIHGGDGIDKVIYSIKRSAVDLHRLSNGDVAISSKLYGQDTLRDVEWAVIGGEMVNLSEL